MKRIASILIWAGICGAAISDTAEVDDTYFHPAASLYIHGDSAAASNLVAKGLSLFPEDAKLKRLKDLLEQQQQQNENQQDQEKDQEQEPNKDQEQEPNKDQEPNNQEQQNEDDRHGQQEEEEQQDQQQQPADQEPRPAEEMTPEEARQLLDAMKQEEKNERMQLRPIMGEPIHVEKDW